MRKSIRILTFALLAAAALFSAEVSAQPTPAVPMPLVQEGATVRVSEHVYVIPDRSVPLVPNVGFVVGRNATLVVDPGIGRRNGEAVLRELAKVSRNAIVYVVPTHFHPEHTTGGAAFPSGTRFVYPQAQQQDVEEFGQQMLDLFRKRSPEIESLLSGATYPSAVRAFDREEIVDLGGVRVRLLLVGPAHTRGDTAIFVEDDKVLFSGDLAMKNAFPAFSSPYSSGRAWLASLDRLKALGATRVVGSHGEMGDASLIDGYRTYLEAVRMRVRELRAQGKSSEEVEKLLTGEFQSKYPAWAASVARVAGAAKAFYAEAD